MLLLRAILNILVRNASPRGHMCLMFSLSGPCEWYVCFVLLPLGPELWWVYSYIRVFYILLCHWAVCFVCCVSDSVWIVWWNKWQYFFGVVGILLLHVIEMFSMGGGALLYRPCMVFQSVCVMCMWSSVHLDVPSIRCVCVCRKLSRDLRVWELDHRCFISSCCFSVWFCILCGLVRACSCYASYPFGILFLSEIRIMFIGTVDVSGYGGLSESWLRVFCELCPVGFLVVGKNSLVLS